MYTDNSSDIGWMLCPYGFQCDRGSSCPFRHEKASPRTTVESIKTAHDKIAERTEVRTAYTNQSFPDRQSVSNSIDFNVHSQRQEAETPQICEPSRRISHQTLRQENVLKNVNNDRVTEICSISKPSFKAQKERYKTPAQIAVVHRQLAPSGKVSHSVPDSVVIRNITQQSKIPAPSGKASAESQTNISSSVLSPHSNRETSARDKVNKIFKEQFITPITHPKSQLQKKLERVKEVCSKQPVLLERNHEAKTADTTMEPRSAQSKNFSNQFVKNTPETNEPEESQETYALERLSTTLQNEQKKRRAKVYGQIAKLDIENNAFAKQEKELCAFTVSKYYEDHKKLNENNNTAAMGHHKCHAVEKPIMSNFDELPEQATSEDFTATKYYWLAGKPIGKVLPTGYGIRNKESREISQFDVRKAGKSLHICRKLQDLPFSNGITSSKQKVKEKAQLPIDDKEIIWDDKTPTESEKIVLGQYKPQHQPDLIDLTAEPKLWNATYDCSPEQKISLGKSTLTGNREGNSINSAAVTKTVQFENNWATGGKMALANKTPTNISPLVTAGVPENISYKKRTTCLKLLYDEMLKTKVDETTAAQVAQTQEKEIAGKATTAHGYQSMIAAAMGEIRKSKKDNRFVYGV